MNAAKRNASHLAALMFINYALNAISFRLLAWGSYVGVAIADALLAWAGFTMFKRITEATTNLEKFGYTVGGVGGSLLGLWLTDVLASLK